MLRHQLVRLSLCREHHHTQTRVDETVSPTLTFSPLELPRTISHRLQAGFHIQSSLGSEQKRVPYLTLTSCVRLRRPIERMERRGGNVPLEMSRVLFGRVENLRDVDPSARSTQNAGNDFPSLTSLLVSQSQ